MSAEMQVLTLTVTGMTCGSCRARVERALQSVAAVEAVEVELGTGAVEVVAPASAVGLEERLITAVRAAGYGVAGAAAQSASTVAGEGSGS